LFKNYLFFYLYLLLISQKATGQSFTSHLEKADSLFAKGAYEAAYPFYRQQLRQQHQVSVRALLRMAYVQEGLGHYPAALYYLSLAQARQPRYATWQKTAELAQQHRLTGYSVSWRQNLVITFRRYYYRGLQLLLLGAVASGIGLLVRRPRNRYWWLTYAGYLGLTGLYLNLLLPGRVGLVARPHAALMAGPSAGADWLTTASAGDRLMVRGQRDIWYQVQWRGRAAYIRRNDLLLIQ
jgi:tetratricopeptide (TPR) repeat protein